MCTSSPKIPEPQPVEPTIIYAGAEPAPMPQYEPPEPTPPPKASKPTTEAAVRARQEQSTRVAKKKGYLGSLLTSGLGEETAAETTKKRLLGGTE